MRKNGCSSYSRRFGIIATATATTMTKWINQSNQGKELNE